MARRYQLQIPPTSYGSQANAAILTPASNQTLQLYDIHLVNRSGSTCDMGALIRLAASSSVIKISSYVAVGPITTDITAAILAGTSENIFTSSNNDGFVVQSTKPFNLAGFTLSQGQSGSPVYSYKYYNGTSFVVLPDMLNVPTWVAGDNVLMFSSPIDWAKGTTAAVGGTSGLYTVWAQATTAGGQNVTATSWWMGRLLAYVPALANNQIFSLLYNDIYPLVLDGLEGLMPYFSVASAKNHVAAKYFSVG